MTGIPSHVHGTSDLPLMGLTIGDLLRRTAQRHGGVEALVARHQQRRYTYAELDAAVDVVARALMSLGLEVGDRVGIWAPNCAEWALVQFATARIGAILVTINPAYRAPELAYALEQSGVRLLVTAPRFRQHDYRQTLAGLLPELATDHRPMELRAQALPQLRQVICLGDEPGRGMMAWAELLEHAGRTTMDSLRERAATVQFDDPINIQYTSGTTGFPKGATLSHHNILNNAFFMGACQRLNERDRVCIPVPLYHCFGMVLGNLACVAHGAAMIYPAETFDPLAVLETVQEECCTALYGVPTMFIAELEHPAFGRFDLSTLRTGIMGGSPCPVEVMRRVRTQMHMPEVTIGYGMTETSPISFQTRPDDDEEKRISTVGTIHPHVEAKIVDPDTGRIVPRGTPGELLTRGYLVMLGYWNNPEGTAAAIDAAGWMHTGDLAVMRDDGYVNIVGRIKDMIIRGGENVYPREVEEFLHTHPKVADVQVIGVPDPKYDEEICAWVKLKERQAATEEEIRAYCRGQIATYKIPRYVVFVDAFPMTVTGKVQKQQMRAAMRERLPEMFALERATA
ncbi:MAG: AMP-binding protein [Chloroflexi bacterium]|nr:AMP-binding protein [Chloroflexota bacterium]